MSFRIACDTSFRVGESPRWNHVDQKLWFSDIPEQKIYAFDPQTNDLAALPIGKNVSGFAFNKQGGFVFATHEGVFLADQSGKKLTLIADSVQGHYLKCNDGITDARGRFIFGTSFYDPGLNHGQLGKLFKVEKDRSIVQLDENIMHSNGMGFSPDNKIFYYTDCAARTIYAYDYDLEHGIPRNRRIFAKIPLHEGLPDGMAVDAQGYVWSAQWYGGVVVRYTPAGEVDFVMRTPGQQTSALAFGGKSMTDIYVTSASHWAYLEDAPTNYEYDVLPPGGKLYLFNYGIIGQQTCFADIL